MSGGEINDVMIINEKCIHKIFFLSFSLLERKSWQQRRIKRRWERERSRTEIWGMVQSANTDAGLSSHLPVRKNNFLTTANQQMWRVNAPQSLTAQVANTRPVGRIQPSTLFDPALLLVSTWWQQRALA